MKRGESSGGGQSSLGYLFGSDNKLKNEQPPPPPPPSPTIKPPYGIDMGDEKPPESPPPSQDKTNLSNNSQRVQRKNSANFITDRPSNKVKSAPGGDSSLGYLFGDKL